MSNDVTYPPTLPALLYQGSVCGMDCVEGGHLNMGLQLQRATVGLAYLAHALEVPRAFTADADFTIVPLDVHIRLLKEAFIYNALTMHGGVLELGESEATLCLDLRHFDGTPCSAYTMRVAHVNARNMQPAPWSERTREAAARLMCEQPDHAKPRSIDVTEPPMAEVSLARGLELKGKRTGATMLFAHECDAFGRMRPEQVIFRCLDAAPAKLASTLKKGEKAITFGTGVTAEMRIAFRAWPRAGDLLVVLSGTSYVGEKNVRAANWLCDPVSGKVWASVEWTSLNIDPKTRRAVPLKPEIRERTQQHMTGMRV